MGGILFVKQIASQIVYSITFKLQLIIFSMHKCMRVNYTKLHAEQCKFSFWLSLEFSFFHSLSLFRLS